MLAKSRLRVDDKFVKSFCRDIEDSQKTRFILKLKRDFEDFGDFLEELEIPFKLDLHSFFKFYLKRGLNSNSMVNISNSNISQSIRNLDTILNQSKLSFNFGASVSFSQVQNSVATIRGSQNLMTLLVLVDRMSLSNPRIRDIIERLFGISLKKDFDDDEICDKLIGDSVRLMMYGLTDRWKKIKYFCYDYVFVFNFETKINSGRNLADLVPRIRKYNQNKMLKIFYGLLPKPRSARPQPPSESCGFYDFPGELEGLNVFVALKLFTHKILHFTVSIDDSVRISYSDRTVSTISRQNRGRINRLDSDIFDYLKTLNFDSIWNKEAAETISPLYYKENFLYATDLQSLKSRPDPFIKHLKFFHYASFLESLEDLISREIATAKETSQAKGPSADQRRDPVISEFVRIKLHMQIRFQHLVKVNLAFLDLFQKKNMTELSKILGMRSALEDVRVLHKSLKLLLKQVHFDLLENSFASFDKLQSEAQKCFQFVKKKHKDQVRKYYLIASFDLLQKAPIDPADFDRLHLRVKSSFENASKFADLNLIGKRTKPSFSDSQKPDSGFMNTPKPFFESPKLSFANPLAVSSDKLPESTSVDDFLDPRSQQLFGSTFMGSLRPPESTGLAPKTQKFYTLKKTKKEAESTRQPNERLFFDQSIVHKLGSLPQNLG